MNTTQYVDKLLNEGDFEQEGDISNVLTYTWTEHDDTAILLEKSADMLFSKLQDKYPNCDLTIKKYPSPNEEYTVEISVYR